MTVTDERENLINNICQYLMPFVPDLSDAKSALYIILDDYEITSRCTAVTEFYGDRNEKLMKRFLIAKTVKGCTPRTIDYYKKQIASIISTIGKTVDDITADDIRYYMAIRQRRDKVSKVTIGNEIRCLGSFFQWLYAEEIIRKNPMTRIDRIKMEKTKKEAFTDLEVERLRVAARGMREKMIIEILLSTGCRVSELVQVLITEIDGSKILIHGKGQKDRYVYLNAKAELALDTYLD